VRSSSLVIDHASILFGAEARATESIYMKPPQLALTLCLVFSCEEKVTREKQMRKSSKKGIWMRKC